MINFFFDLWDVLSLFCFASLVYLKQILTAVKKHIKFTILQDHLQEKETQKSKMAVWGGLTNSCEKKRSEKQRRKGKV